MIFGGFTNESWVGFNISNVIASFDTTTKQWNKLGELNQARYGHGVILHQGQFIVAGGWGFILFVNERGTERCTLKGDSIQCKTVDPELEDYKFYPEMISVRENFCPK